MTSAIAIFGNQSFFYTAANSSNSTSLSPTVQICQQGNIPFSRLGRFILDEFGALCNDIDSDSRGQRVDEDDLAQFLESWIIGFNDTDSSEGALGASMYFASQAMLDQTANA